MWRRAQRVAFWILIAGGVLALAAAIGASPIPRGPAGLAWALHGGLLAFGAACGVASVARAREIDRERWRVLGDPSLTTGEREYAHKEAESEIRSAGTVFVLCGVSLGAFGAYQLREPGRLGVADLLIVTPLAGFALGVVVGLRLFPSEAPRP